MAGFLDFLKPIFGGAQGLTPHNPTTGVQDAGYGGQSQNPASLLAGGGMSHDHINPLRDIVGSLADGYLMANGHDAVYAPARQEMKQRQALEGFVNDPLAAIQRLAQTPGGSKAAIELYKQYQTHAEKETDDKRLDATSASTISKNNLAAYGPIAGWANTLNRNNYSHILPIIQKIASDHGLDLPPFDQNDPEGWGKQVSTAAMGAYKADRADQFGQQIDINRQNADTNATRAAQGQEKINQVSPNTVLGNIYQKIQNGQGISQAERLLYNDSIRNKVAATQNSRTNQQNANSNAIRASKAKDHTVPPDPSVYPPDISKYPTGLNDGVNHFIVVNKQWVKK